MTLIIPEMDLDWEGELDVQPTYAEKFAEWIRRPPYKKRELRGELAYLKFHIKYSKRLPNDYRCRRKNLDSLLKLAAFYLKRAESAIERSDFLEFHINITHSDRVLFHHLLLYEEFSGKSPNLLELRKTSLEHALLNEPVDFDYDERKLIEKIRSEEDVTIEEWIRTYRMIHKQSIEEHEKERIQQSESNKRVRQLAITTTITFGTGLAIILGIFGTPNIPLIGSIEPPGILADNENMLTFVAMFGLLGAVVSDLSKYSSSAKSSSSVEGDSAVNGFWATIAKYVFGATSAVIIIIILYSGFLPAVDQAELTGGITLVLAFASGFSERIVKRAMESVSF